MIRMTRSDEEIQEAVVEIRKRKRKQQRILLSVAAAIMLLILTAIWFYGYRCAKNSAAEKIDELNRQIHQLQNTPVVLDPVTPEILLEVLSSKTAEISELASAEYVFTNSARFTDTKGIAAIFDWMTKKAFIQKWDGVIKAGVSLDTLTIDVTDAVITLTLPQAKILSYEVDYDSVEVLDEKNNIFNPISVKDKAAFDKSTAEDMKNRAISNGLLERAQKNAENILATILMTAVDNAENYRIEFVYTTE